MFGLSYRSQVNVTVEGKTELKELQDATAFAFGGSEYKTNTTTELKFPQSVLLGYGFKPNDKWTVYADYEWVNWNVVTETKFNYEQNNPNLTQQIARNWKNTNNLGIGTQWKVTPMVDLRGGFLTYESVVPSSTLESSIPDSSRWALTLGSGVHFGNTSVDLGYNAIFFKKRTIDNNAGNATSSMDGTYKTMINVFSLGFSQKW